MALGRMPVSGLSGLFPGGGMPVSPLHALLRKFETGVHVVHDLPHPVGRRLGRTFSTARECRQLLELIGEFPKPPLLEQLHDVDHEPPELRQEHGTRRLNAHAVREAPAAAPEHAAAPCRHLFHDGAHAVPLALGFRECGELGPGLRAERACGHLISGCASTGRWP